MRPMTRTHVTALACALAACAALAPPAHARNTQEIGAPGGLQFPKADCPKNAQDPNDTKGCQAVAQVTGFNVRLNGVHNPMRLKRSGYIVAFTIELAKPDANQIAFFKATYGEHATARLAIIQSLHDQAQYRLINQTQAFDLEPYFGSTPTIALRKPFRVHKDDIVAITVPTWVPAFSHNLDSEEIWRSSHEGADCTAPNPPAAPHEQIGSAQKYECVYRTARLLYTATFIGDPKPTNVASKR
jgi:hypothetical protein